MYKKSLFFCLILFVAAGTQARQIDIYSVNEIITLDPAITYDWLGYSLVSEVCGYLLREKRNDSGEYSPNLDGAASYTIENQNKSYHFTLRDDLYFHNGRKVVAEDVVYSINRSVDPQIQSPGATFFEVIKGYDEVRSGLSKTLEGVKALDDRTVVFDLKRPSVAFLHILTTNFACIIAKESVDSGEITYKPISFGPLKIDNDYRADKTVHLSPAKMSLKHYKFMIKFDRLVITTGKDLFESLAAFSVGEINLIYDPIPWGVLNMFRKDTGLEELLIKAEHAATTYLALNSNIPPLDNANVRRAINLAVDRTVLDQALGEDATATRQILPPSFSAYDREHSYDDYDPEKARRLLKQEGFSEGIETDIYAVNFEGFDVVVEHIQTLLTAVGIHARIHYGTNKEILEIAGDPNNGAIIFSDGLAWIADYYDESNFYFPLFSQGAAEPGGWNWSFYINPELDELATQADTLVGEENRQRHASAWREIFKQMMQDTPWVPLYNRTPVYLFSKDLQDEFDLIKALFRQVNAGPLAAFRE